MEFRIATTGDCELINRLAAQIWAPTYSHLMSPEQLEYMFEMMYGIENLQQKMTEEGAKKQTFLIFSDEKTDVGYVAYENLGGGGYYLQKIYLLPSLQGRGAGRKMLESFVEYIRKNDPRARRLGLNVNRDNKKAIDFYLRNGFEITSQRDHPIGHGYFMYDYILEKEI